MAVRYASNQNSAASSGSSHGIALRRISSRSSRGPGHPARLAATRAGAGPGRGERS